METNRLEAFSDGVFAIAITLLILEIRVPEAGGDSLGRELLHLWPSYLSYAISFVTIGIIWVNHHGIFRLVRYADRPLLFLNVFFLMCVAFIPFPTALVAEHIEGEGARDAALAYGLTLTLTAVAFNGLWHYPARGRRLMSEDASPREVTGITRSYIPGPFIYGGSTLVAFWSPDASLVLFAAIALFYVVSSSLWGTDTES